MRPSSVALVTTTLAGGAALLASYYHVFAGEGTGYTRSRFWLGLDPSLVASVAVTQVFAGVGFLAFLGSCLAAPPRRGVLAYLGGWALPLTVGVFLAASVAWPWCARWALGAPGVPVAYGSTALSLTIAAAACIVMVAGMFEASGRGRTGTMGLWGAANLAFVVVLLDGVGWNARFLAQQMHPGP